MTNIIRPITPEISTAIDLFEAEIERFLSSFRPIFRNMGKFEAEIEAYNLISLAIRNIEGMFILARNDLVLLPSALILSRSSFEISIRALWLLQPSDPYKREARWLAHLHDEIQYYERLIKKYKQLGSDPIIPIENLIPLKEFYEGVKNKLPPNCESPKRLPKFEEMRNILGLQSAYPIYAILSQFTHGTHYATWLYRLNLGTMKLSGEFTSPHQWHIPLSTSWWSINEITSRIITITSANPSVFISKNKEIIEAIEIINNKF